MMLQFKNAHLYLASVACGVAATVLPLPAAAQARDATSAPETIIRLYPGAAPGSESWSGPESRDVRSNGPTSTMLISNVTVPRLSVFPADPAKANGTAVIIVPGGGFNLLAYDVEGTEIAHWFAVRGVTAFVLAYRVRPGGGGPGMPGAPGAGGASARGTGAPSGASAPASARESGSPLQARAFALADALQAIKVVRQNAAKYSIAPDRVGMLGFSAGAMTTMRVLLEGRTEPRLAFAASIYGSMPTDPVPPNSPPLFLVAAADDKKVPISESVNIFEKWHGAALPVELHVFERGGHAFGIRKKGNTTDDWTTLLERWMTMHKLLGS